VADADFLATEHFYLPGQAEDRRRIAEIPLAGLLQRLDDHLEDVAADSRADSKVVRQRAKVLAQCREAAARPPGVFSLSVPTGGGKTLSSLAFALRHAVAHGLRRVIYVIPYTSIIEQTADVFRRAFGELAEAVVEHHSTAAPLENEDTMGPRRLKLAVDNWDAPVIVTTSVQFFESLHAARPSACRKLHNIAESVVVLDEVQALPTAQLAPCVRALRELAERCRTTVLLCSATLPDLRQSTNLGAGFAAVDEIIDDVDALFADLARVDSERAGFLDDDTLVGCLAAEPRVLCIVESRAHAAELYGHLAERGGAFHLSASMCPAHRRAVLAEVRARLDTDAPCRLVATPVVEAGVDVDFPVVFRAAAGIDSLAQAAGRCNRNGRQERGRFVVFEAARPSRLRDLARRRTLAAPLLAEGGDPLGRDVVARYFATLLAVERGAMDESRALERMNNGRHGLNWPFRSIARDFRMIDQDTRPVVVDWRGKAAPLVAEVEAGNVSLAAVRALQQHSVAAWPGEIAALRAAGALREFGPDGRFLKLTRDEFYGDTGLRVT
ncbi:MAG: CRISPR-associated helicase Cas3', partial [Actinomycetota bacterium]